MLFSNLKEVIHTIALRYFIRKKLPKGHVGKNSYIHTPSLIAKGSLQNIYLGDNVNIDWDNVIYASNARFVMGDNSGAAVGLTVVTGNHIKEPGVQYERASNSNLKGADIIVEDRVWLAANVTLLSGAHIGRGAIIGAGSVVRNVKIPPYAIVIGNPAKVVGFKYTPEQILLHEKVFYPEDQRLSLEVLKKNEEKFVNKRAKQLLEFVKL